MISAVIWPGLWPGLWPDLWPGLAPGIAQAGRGLGRAAVYVLSRGTGGASATTRGKGSEEDEKQSDANPRKKHPGCSSHAWL